MLKVRRGLSVALLLGVIAGCSSGNPQVPSKVSGMVTYKNAPVTAGTIVFHPESGAPYGCPLAADGTYEIVDLPSGSLVVTIETESANPTQKVPEYGGGKGSKDYAERMKAEKALGMPVKEGTGGQYRKIPPKYANPKTSPLTVTLEAGRQVENFTLTD
jgi:hypothetical protein